MKQWKAYHPLVDFVYFVAVLGFSCVLMHPICLAISLGCGFANSVMLSGWEASRRRLRMILPTMVVTALLNPAFNHAGVTILAYLPNGNPLTLESVWYGLAAATMMGSVLCWFACLCEVMTEDKITDLFGRVTPALALLFTMTLRFVPRLSAQLRAVSEAQRCLGGAMVRRGVIARAKQGLMLVSAVTTWALENAVETAESMRARGYGLPGRTAFSIYRKSARDRRALTLILGLSLGVLVGSLTGALSFRYFPSCGGDMTLRRGWFFVFYGILCGWPMILEGREARRWNAIASKI